MAGRKTNLSKMSVEKIEKKHMTDEQRQYQADVRAGRHDPVAFAEKILGIQLHSGQKLWLWMTTKTQLDKAFAIGLTLRHKNRALWANREEFDSLRERNPDMMKNILVPSNRWGKTLVTTVKHLWFNFYKIGVKGEPGVVRQVRCGTLNLSPHSNQCQAAYDYVLDILNSKFVFNVPEIQKDGAEKIVTYKNECRIPNFMIGSNSQKRLIQFNNDTTFRAVPTGEDQASSLAGTAYLYISYDECAQSLHLKDELPAKVMSRLIDFGGPLDLVSTPEVDKPSHQYFFRIAKLGLTGKEGWWTLPGMQADNTFLGKKESEMVLDAIKSTDPAKYRQVKFGEFVSTGKKMFDNLVIQRIWDRFDGRPDLPQVGRRYIVSADWGFSDTGDPSVFIVLDVTDVLNTELSKPLRRYRIAHAEDIKGGDPLAVLSRFMTLSRMWNNADRIHDATSMGGVIIGKLLRGMTSFDPMNSNSKLVDFAAAKGNKLEMLFILQLVMTEFRDIEYGKEMEIVDKNPDFGRLRGYLLTPLEEQLGNYQYNPDKGVTDKRIEQDYVVTLGQAVWYIEKKVLKRSVGSIKFNPLAVDPKDIFSEKDGKTIHFKVMDLSEKVI